jgi:ribose transport system permease protein
VTKTDESVLDAPGKSAAGKADEPAPGSAMGQRLASLLRQYAVAIVILVVGAVALAIFVPEFYNKPNLINVGRQTSLVGIVAVGMTFVILTAGIDLSVGAILGLVSVVVGKMINGGSPEGIAIIAGVAAGVGVGLFNALGVTRFRLQPFIMTLATSAIVAGLALRTTDGTQLQIKLFEGGIFGWLSSGSVLGFPAPLIVFIACAVAAGVVLRYTPFGRYVYAVGGSQEAARLSGIRVWPVLFGVYAIAGLCAAIAGTIFTARLNVADPNAGTLTTLDAIAAVVIGGTSLMGGVGGMTGTVLGAFLLAALANVLNLRGVSPFDQQMVKGAVIILAVLWASYGVKSLPAFRRKKTPAHDSKAGPPPAGSSVSARL